MVLLLNIRHRSSKEIEIYRTFSFNALNFQINESTWNPHFSLVPLCRIKNNKDSKLHFFPRQKPPYDTLTLHECGRAK